MAYLLRSKTNRRRSRRNAEVNMTNLMDIMMVLLVVFMVTAPMMTSGIALDLPKVGGQNLAGKETTFEFTVKAIYTELTPETITDAMVAENFKENYEVSTVAEFMDVMKKELVYNLVINHVIEKSTFDIPEEYLDLRLEEYQNLFTELYCTQIDLESFLAYYYGTTLDKIKVEWASALQSQIKAELVFEAIVKGEDLKIDESGLKEYVNTISSAATSGGNTFYIKEENIYKMLGVGNVEEGKQYYLNQSAVRDYIMENYK